MKIEEEEQQGDEHEGQDDYHPAPDDQPQRQKLSADELQDRLASMKLELVQLRQRDADRGKQLADAHRAALQNHMSPASPNLSPASPDLSPMSPEPASPERPVRNMF